jgi:hypothetical protein
VRCARESRVSSSNLHRRATNRGRTGSFTTAIISVAEGKHIALFYSARKHAGENLAKLLTARGLDRERPILMSAMRSIATCRKTTRWSKPIALHMLAAASSTNTRTVPRSAGACSSCCAWVFSVECACKLHRLSPDEYTSASCEGRRRTTAGLTALDLQSHARELSRTGDYATEATIASGGLTYTPTVPPGGAEWTWSARSTCLQEGHVVQLNPSHGCPKSRPW